MDSKNQWTKQLLQIIVCAQFDIPEILMPFHSNIFLFNINKANAQSFDSQLGSGLLFHGKSNDIELNECCHKWNNASERLWIVQFESNIHFSFKVVQCVENIKWNSTSIKRWTSKWKRPHDKCGSVCSSCCKKFRS